MAASGKILRVLVVDNNRDGADALGLLVEELGNQVHVTYGGTQAFDVANTFRPDLMLVDLFMPEMDGRGRALDNVFIERLWRTVKYEEVYLRDYADGWEAEERLGAYFEFYRGERIHQSLGYRTPAAVYRVNGSRQRR